MSEETKAIVPKEKKASLVSIITTAIQIPGVKVVREDFLKSQFEALPSEEIGKILQMGPVAAGVERELLWKKAQRLIKERAAVSSGASFMAGLPGGWAMAATIPADIVQFYGVALRLAQELAYLYGEEDMWCDGTVDSDKVTNQLILYCGVMLGASGASSTVRVMSAALAKQALKKLPQKALMKTIYYPIVKSIAKFFGVRMTKEIFAKGVSKAVPIVGGVVSGGITLASMLPMGNRLAKTLDKAHFDYSEEDFEKDMSVIADVCEREAKSKDELDVEDVSIIENRRNTSVQDSEPIDNDSDEWEDQQDEFDGDYEHDDGENAGDSVGNIDSSNQDDEKNEKKCNESRRNNSAIANDSDSNHVTNFLEQIRQAKELQDLGIITEEEFSQIKSKIISQI